MAAPLLSGPRLAAAEPVVLVRDAAHTGMTHDRLRSVSWRRLSRGLYVPHGTELALPELAGALANVLPHDSGFGHLTSAALRGWWLPNRLRRHVVFASTRSKVHVQREGIYVRRSPYAEFEVVDGLAVATPAQTLVELARDLSLLDLVPMVDCALREGADPDEIMRAARPRLRGSATLKRAVRLSEPASESWWESLLRLLHVLPGLGPVASQVEIWDSGVFVTRADLHLVGTSRYPECDGGEHRDATRHQADLRRDRRMSSLRFERYGYTTADIALRPAVVIRDAEQARGLPHDPKRIKTWLRAARSSTLTSYGRTRLAARLERYHMAAVRRHDPAEK